MFFYTGEEHHYPGRHKTNHCLVTLISSFVSVSTNPSRRKTRVLLLILYSSPGLARVANDAIPFYLLWSTGIKDLFVTFFP